MTASSPTHHLYRGIQRILPVNIAYLLWLSTQDFLPSKPVDGATCRVLTARDIGMLARIPDFAISDQTVQDFEALNGLGIGIFVHDQLAGISLYFANQIPARHLSTSARYRGNAVSLPPGTRLLYKAFVLPQHRGQRLNSAMVRFAINHLGTDTVHTLMTTANVANSAYLSSVLDQGFEIVGCTMEASLFGKHHYRLPKPVDSLTGKQSDEDDGCVVLQAGNP